MKIILGSASPRRKEILSSIINDLVIISPEIDESRLKNEPPIDFSLRISEEKAASLIKTTGSPSYSSLLITSDTTVTISNEILGKPASYDEAIAMLKRLSGRIHRVISSITIMQLEKGKKIILSRTDCEITEVTFNRLNSDDIEAYLKKINYRDKAGAYAIQHHGDMIIRSVKGSITNVIGFPLRLFFSMIVKNRLENIFLM